MVKALPLLLLVSCVGARGVSDSTTLAMTAPKKAAAPDPRFFPECSTLEDAPEAREPAWESLVLTRDVQLSSSGACEPLERALTPLAEAPSLSRPALREECDAKSAVLPAEVRSSCRAVCAARRWLEGRTLARQRATVALKWFRDDFDFAFERIEQCLAGARHGNQLGDVQVQQVFACGGKPLPPELSLRFQYVTEPVSWRENGGTLSSARPVEAQWLEATDPDPNLPWRRLVTRCLRGSELHRVLVRQ